MYFEFEMNSRFVETTTQQTVNPKQPREDTKICPVNNRYFMQQSLFVQKLHYKN